jgi:hypothetical protein
MYEVIAWTDTSSQTLVDRYAVTRAGVIICIVVETPDMTAHERALQIADALNRCDIA